MPVTTHSIITDNNKVIGNGRVVLTINHKESRTLGKIIFQVVNNQVNVNYTRL
ncbi:MAG: hypothetical protein IJJ11_02425 [Methanosphaera sp.]|nr:hypothetical protein [Methanosphaera sp.]